MDSSPHRDPPWGTCPRCARALVRDELLLQAWPMRIAMPGPPVCPGCTPEEIEQYLALWEPQRSVEYQDAGREDPRGERSG
ncbi:hypothetical protein ACFW1A_20545 [Kitasatospora sp. NPDC058965]|uniref:hypothetical protein n=1 Tax=Kitasatospora sp. NPDC058965 TaxID=3346682 RepID=UPI0036B03E97